MKKLLTVCVAAVLLLSLAACGKTDTDTITDSKADKPAAETAGVGTHHAEIDIQDYGVSVHRADCPNASAEKRAEQPNRWIRVSWGTDTNDSYPTTIEAVCKDRLNLLLDISAALSSTKTFVLGLNTRSTEDGFAIIRVEVRIKDGTQLNNLMNKLHQISGVLKVTRPVG